MKKLLSILLTTTMLASVFAISANAFVPTKETTMDVIQHYDGTDDVNFIEPVTAGFCSPTVENGVLNVTSPDFDTRGYSTGVHANVQPAATKYTIMFDITRNKDITYEVECVDAETGEITTETVTITEDGAHKASVAFMLPRNTAHPALGAFGLWLPMDGMTVGEARTYSITVDETAAANATAVQVSDKYNANKVVVFTEVKYKDAGDESWTYPERSGNSATAYQYRVFAGKSAAQKTLEATDGKIKNADVVSQVNAYQEGITVSERLHLVSAPPAPDEKAYADIPYTYDNIIIKSAATECDIVEGVQHDYDFEAVNSKYSNHSSVEVAELMESNGNTFYRLTPTEALDHHANAGIPQKAEKPQYLGTFNTTTSDGCNVYPGCVVTLDVRYVTKGMPLTFLVAKNAAYYEATDNGKKPMALSLFPRELNKWYTYKVEFGNFGISDNVESFMKVYVKERGAADSTYTLLNGMSMSGVKTLKWNSPSETYDMDKFDYGLGSGWGTIAGGKTAHIGYSTYKCQDPSWTYEVFQGTITDIDNFQIRDKVAFSGKEATVADGVLSTELCVETAEEGAASAIVAVYNNDGRLADVDFDILNGGVDNVAELSASFDAATQTALLYIWKDISTSVTPLCEAFTGLVSAE